jgi:hypothetical protein
MCFLYWYFLLILYVYRLQKTCKHKLKHTETQNGSLAKPQKRIYNMQNLNAFTVSVLDGSETWHIIWY